jgi:BirA family biotin operon repressor/biotin-[acetyl-CoA-carboxylase] ligase
MNSTPFAPDAPWRIDRTRLATLAERPARDWTIDIVDETGSTNADLMERLRASRRGRPPDADGAAARGSPNRAMRC